MGKVPALVHHREGGDRIITECAAICHYLAETAAPSLLAHDAEKSEYFRLLFFAAGPLEQAITARNMGWDPAEPEKQATTGFGSYERTVDAFETLLQGRDFVCGERFTMADVYVGSQVIWGVQFGTLPKRDAFEAYASRLTERTAYIEAKAIDAKLIEENANG